MDDGSGLQYLVPTGSTQRLTDHLGSVVATTNASGTLTSQQRYMPFGEVPEDIGTIAATDFGYTGQRDLGSEVGLMDYKARFYSPYINHFLQPDSIIPDLFDPQSWNRYSYVQNNPTNHIDPTGHQLVIAAAITFAVVAVALTAYIYNTPQMKQLGQEAAESLPSEVKGWGKNTTHQKELESIERSSYTTGSNNLGPGFGYKNRGCGFWCIAGVASFIGFVACAAMFKEQCSKAASAPTPPATSTSTPTLTPTNTSTSTPDCPPLRHCPTTPRSTPTQTHTPTPTDTPTPTLPPTPTLISTPTSSLTIFEKRLLRKGLLE